jgi:hypothetical protein
MVTDVESSYSLLRNISSSFRKTFVKYLSFAIDPGNRKRQFMFQTYSSVPSQFVYFLGNCVYFSIFE